MVDLLQHMEKNTLDLRQRLEVLVETTRVLVQENAVHIEVSTVEFIGGSNLKLLSKNPKKKQVKKT